MGTTTGSAPSARAALGAIPLTVALGLAAVLAAGCADRDVEDLVDDATTTTVAATPSTGGAPGTGDDPATGPDTIAWGGCDDLPEGSDPALECGSLAVPLDPEDPSGETIDLALVRYPASGERRGVVLTNPGGPGASGVDFIAQAGGFLRGALGLEDFDVVGFDPRGVDRSGGVRCLTDAEWERYLYLDDTPDTPEEEAESTAAETLFADACAADHGDDLQHYSTVNTAHDMDRIRAAMGVDRVSYYGASYGTYLGAVYATLHPDRVEAMILDAAFEPTGDTVEQQWSTDLVSFEAAFDRWTAWCEEDETCAVHGPDVGATWDALREALDAAPVPAADGRLANQLVLDFATLQTFYAEVLWPELAQAMADAQAGDGTGLYDLADSYNAREPDGTYPTYLQSLMVINCASGLTPSAPEDPVALAAELAELAPRFGAEIEPDDLASDQGCGDLVPDAELPALSYDGDAPILVIGGTQDVATPFRWAEEMAEAMGPSAVLLTYTGEGHGFVGLSSCVTDLAARVISAGVLPEPGTSCDADQPVERPEWWDEVPVPERAEPVDGATVLAAIGLGPTVAYSEVYAARVDADTVLAASRSALEDVFAYGGLDPGPEIGPDAQQQYWFPGRLPDDFFMVLTLGPETLAALGLGDLAEPGGVVVVVSYFP
jgi:pimeloyl-ACP methyl ester carboxylesterase